MKLNIVYIFSIIFVFISVIFSFNVILFFLTTVISTLFGVIVLLELNSSNVAKEFELFNEKQNDPIHFTRCRHHLQDYLSNSIINKIKLIPKLELNKKFTNNSEIDYQLNKVFELIFKNHIHPWFQYISTNQEFPRKLYLFLNQILSSFIKHLKKIELSNLIITKFVDEITKHKRLYRITKSKLEFKIHDNEEEFIQLFFSMERRSEKTFSHEKVCLDQQTLYQFLSRICDIFIFNFFPYESFRNETVKIITKEIFIKIILSPLLETFSEPDFINRIIIMLLKSNYPSTETFISILQSIEDVNELKAVLESVENEILFVRSKDHDDDKLKMKQQLSSLLYLKKIILSHLKKFDVSVERPLHERNSFTTQTSDEDKMLIPFDPILNRNTVLEYFINFTANEHKYEKFNFYIKNILLLQPSSILFLQEKIENIEKFLDNDSNTSKKMLNSNVNVSSSQVKNIFDSFQRLSRTLSFPDLNKKTVQENKQIFQTDSVFKRISDIKRHNSSNDLTMNWNGNNNYDVTPNCELNECEENIPLLLLLDEVFDLKNQNSWLRWPIIELFKQIIEATYSDTINKKLVDYINEWTSPASICNYMELFRNIFWSQSSSLRSIPKEKKNCLRRKVAAKALILTFLSDLKIVVGNDTLQIGLISFFELFQNKTLNMRLILILLELFLKELLPQNYFDEIFKRLYKAFDEKNLLNETKNDWPPYLSNLKNFLKVI